MNNSKYFKIISEISNNSEYTFPNTQLVKFYKSSHVYANLARIESFGITIIEAMASGKPIIATDIGPSRELIGEKSGLLVSNTNISEVVNAIMSIIECKDQFERFGRHGLERVNKFFNQIDYIRKIERIIEKNC